MTQTPPLQNGEDVVFDHFPSARVFKRTALMMIGLTIPVVVVFLYVFPDTIWPTVPLFVTCVILMQERVRLGRYRAWITNQRVILQGGDAISLNDVARVAARTNGVQIVTKGDRANTKLHYPENPAALITAIETAQHSRAQT